MVRSTVARRIRSAMAGGVLLAAVAGAALGGAAPATARGPGAEQWYLDQIGVPAAHRVSRGDGVAIGAFSNAPEINHPDLRGQLLPGANFTFGEGKLTSASPSADPSPTLAGPPALMVSRGETGLLGVAPAAKVRPTTGGTTGGAQVRWLVDHGVRVINFYRNPIGYTPSVTAAEEDALRYALSKDVVVVVDQTSAGTQSLDATGLVVVGATDRNNRRVTDRRGTGSTEQKPPVSVVAPDASGRVRPPGPTGELYWDVAFFPEESAAAIVSGVAALIRAKYPELKAASVIDRMLRTAKDLGPSGRDDEYGHGLVNAAAALTTDVAPVTANPLGDPGPPRTSGTGADVPSTQRKLRRVAPYAAGALLVAALGVGVVVVLLRRRQRRRRPAG